MKLIALSGGIAAGKTTIARRLSELGAVHIDADQLAREAVAPGSEGLERIGQHFGESVLADDGSLDRAALAQIVFGDEAKLDALNGIVHPEVHRLLKHKLEQVRAEDPGAIVVYDVPLLAEAGDRAAGRWDLVVIADAPAEVRIERMVSLRGMSAEEAEQRISNQASDESRRALADVIIDTSGTEAHTLEQVDRLWASLNVKLSDSERS